MTSAQKSLLNISYTQSGFDGLAINNSRDKKSHRTSHVRHNGTRVRGKARDWHATCSVFQCVSKIPRRPQIIFRLGGSCDGDHA
jgi:hypothetical protein